MAQQLPDRSDVVVVGAGIMGRAVAWQMAHRGAAVVVLEQYEHDHELGSSHGSTRALRYGYEQNAYSRLAMHAYTWWRVVERKIDAQLLTMCGGLDFGQAGLSSFDHTLMTVRELGLDYELLASDSVSRRFPVFDVPRGYLGLYEPGAGLIDARRALTAFRELSEAAGARYVWNARVKEVTRDTTGCRVRVAAGDSSREMRCDRVVLCAGPWTKELAGSQLSMQIIRCEPLHVTVAGPDASSDALDAGSLPLFLIHPGGECTDGVYGQFQNSGSASRRTVKIGRHAGTRTTQHSEIDVCRRAGAFVRGLDTTGVIEQDICFYSMTPDEGFYLDWLDRDKRVFVCAGFSGHGFKFAPVVGAAVADLMDSDNTDYEIDSMTLNRFNS